MVFFRSSSSSHSTLSFISVVLVTLLTLHLLDLPSYCDAFSNRYYDMINDVNAGVDYYAILQVSSDSTQSEIKKSYYALSRIYHPDKNNTEQAKIIFLKIQTAYEVLSDQQLKAEYDDLNKNGVPWQEQYYGQYVHRYGVPQHDIRHVLIGVIIIITIGKYSYQWYRYEVIVGLAKRTARYKQKKNELKQQKSLDNDSNSLKTKKNREESSEEPEIILHGTEKPTWKSLFVIELVVFPFWLICWLWSLMFGKPMTQEQKIQQFCEKEGITQEEYDKRVEQHQQRMEKLKNSSKYKRATRWMKKNS